MPDQLQLRGGTTAQHTSFTGASKEVTVDTTKKTAVVHDGSTVGGVPLLREDGSNSALALGSQGTPSLKWDANTGIYSPGEDQLAVATNGTGRLFVDSNGLVGIGATPTSKLEVSHSGSNVVNLTGPANASLVMTGASVGLVLRCGGEATFGATTNDPLALITNNTERLRITSAGLVGIGTSSPGALLEASSATGSATPTPTEIRLSSTTNANDWSTTDPWARLGFYSADTTGGARLRGAIDTIQTFSNGNVSSLVFKLDDASTGLVERMRVTYDGKVGIGTTSPLKELQINATTPTIRLEENGGGSKRLEFSVNSSAEAKVFAEQSGSQLLFGTVGSERARIDSSGRLLVGTSTARSTVKVGGTSGNTPTIQLEGSNNSYSTSLSITNFNVNSYGPALALNASKGSQATPAAVSIGGDLGFLTFNGYDGTNFIPGAHIAAAVDGTPGTNDMPGRLVFSTTADGASSPTERVRIDSRGAVRTGNNTLYTGTTEAVTASTGTTVFTFDFFGTATRRTALVKLSVMHLVATNSIAAQPAAEYIFAVEGYTTGVSAATTPTAAFQNVYVAATHFAFADTGNTSFTITLTNPSASAASAVYYKVEVLDNAGALDLSSVTTT